MSYRQRVFSILYNLVIKNNIGIILFIKQSCIIFRENFFLDKVLNFNLSINPLNRFKIIIKKVQKIKESF